MLVCAVYPGWTIEYVESILDGPFLRRFCRHINTYPPTFMLVRAYLGYEPPPDRTEPQSDEDRLKSFVAAFSAAGGALS